jgi:hypothetical protein
MDYSKLESKGLCPICDREMYDVDNSINRHHFVPKSRGGRATEWCHRVCHDFLHRTWTNKELEREFSDPELIKQDPRAQTFIEWIQKKDPLFYISTKANNRRKGR